MLFVLKILSWWCAEWNLFHHHHAWAGFIFGSVFVVGFVLGRGWLCKMWRLA